MPLHKSTKSLNRTWSIVLLLASVLITVLGYKTANNLYYFYAILLIPFTLLRFYWMYKPLPSTQHSSSLKTIAHPRNLLNTIKSVKWYHWIILTILPLICIVVFILPIDTQNTLALHYANPEWWQVLTFFFVHMDFGHIQGNLIGFFIYTTLSLILATHLGIAQKYLKTLFISTIVISFLTAFFGIWYYPRYLPLFQLGGGLSGVNSAMLSIWFMLSLRVLLPPNSKLTKQHVYLGILLPTIFLVATYARGLQYLLLGVITLLLLAILYHERHVWNTFKTYFPSQVRNHFYISLFALMGIFIILYPHFFFPAILREGNIITDITIHYFGLVFGIVAGYVLCRKVSTQ